MPRPIWPIERMAIVARGEDMVRCLVMGKIDRGSGGRMYSWLRVGEGGVTRESGDLSCVQVYDDDS
jgi:hypothetical protein